jgi:nucleoid-associated protein YgaU
MWKKYLKNLEFPESYISITLGFLVVIVAGLMFYNYVSKNKPVNQANNSQNVKFEEKKGETDKTLPTTHTVVANENLWTIAMNYYGSGYNWKSIAEENKLVNPDVISTGTKLIIPKAEVIKPNFGQTLSTATEKPSSYVVVKGDNLWNIAEKIYGDGFSWIKIAKANNLVSPDIIHSGNVLKIP